MKSTVKIFLMIIIWRKNICYIFRFSTGPEYCIGILSADEDSDLMDAASWSQWGRFSFQHKAVMQLKGSILLNFT